MAILVKLLNAESQSYTFHFFSTQEVITEFSFNSTLCSYWSLLLH